MQHWRSGTSPPMKPAALDSLRALLLRAAALREGEKARAAAPNRPSTPQDWAKPAERTSEKAHEVEVSVEKNRLHLTMRGFFGVAQAEAMLLDVQLALSQVKPGFDVVSDVSRLGALTATAGALVRRLATVLVESGMRQMVRVVGSAPGAATNLARAVEGLYAARVAASTAEAARILDREAKTGASPSPPSQLERPPRRRRVGKRSESAARPAAKARR